MQAELCRFEQDVLFLSHGKLDDAFRRQARRRQHHLLVGDGGIGALRAQRTASRVGSDHQPAAHPSRVDVRDHGGDRDGPVLGDVVINAENIDKMTQYFYAVK